MDESLMDETVKSVLLVRAVTMIEKLIGGPHHSSVKRFLGEYVLYRQCKGNEVSYAVSLGAGGVVVLYAERHADEHTPHKFHSGNYQAHRLPDLVDELERLLVLERLSEI